MSLNVDKHHLVRYCKKTHIENGIPTIAAFILRSQKTPPEVSLSTDWYEYFKHDHYKNIIDAMKDRHFEPKENGYLSKFSIRSVQSLINKNLNINIEIENDKKSHCLVKNLQGKDSFAAFYFVEATVDTIQISDIA